MPRGSLIQFRKGTAAEWTARNPVLALAEPGLETDTGKVKYGDGTTAWSSLAYSSGGSEGGVTDHGALTGLLDDDHPQYVKTSSLSELIDDRVSSLLVAGTNITITYDDTANTLTLSASGSGEVNGYFPMGF